MRLFRTSIKSLRLVVISVPNTLLSSTEIRHASLCAHVILFLSVTVLNNKDDH